MLCNVCLTNEAWDNSCCVACHFSGKQFESYLLSEDRSNLLGRIREIAHVSSAQVWHLGQGLFNLGVMLDDGRIIAPGVGIEMGEEEVLVQPAVPPQGVPWGVSVALPITNEDGFSQQIVMLQDTFDDEELVGVVDDIASGRRPVDLPEAEEDQESLISDELARTWVTGTGQLIGNVHPPDQCEGHACVVHHPSEHKMVDWPTNYRGREIVIRPPFTERMCEHGIGHPDPDDIALQAAHGNDISQHECDGCCDE